MISEHQLREVQRYLNDGVLSKREIARRAGVNRETVTFIASGKRSELKKNISEGDDEPEAVYERCPTCGGRVVLPCRVCRTREFARKDAKSSVAKQSTQKKPPDEEILVLDGMELLGFGLRLEEQLRFEEVKRRRAEIGFIEELFGASADALLCPDEFDNEPEDEWEDDWYDDWRIPDDLDDPNASENEADEDDDWSDTSLDPEDYDQWNEYWNEYTQNASHENRSDRTQESG